MSPSKAGLDTLPEEVLFRIVTYLGKRDAKSLAITCKATRNVAETLIWQGINVSIPFRWIACIPKDLPLNMVNSIPSGVYGPVRRLHYCRHGNDDDWSEIGECSCGPDAQRVQVKLLSRLGQIHSAFTSNSRRINQVLKFETLLSRDTVQSNTNLLKMIQKRLKTISIQMAGKASSIGGPQQKDLIHFYHAIYSAPNLSTLVFHIPSIHWRSNLRMLLTNCRNLNRLHLICADGDPSYHPFEGINEERVNPPKSCPRLRYLEIDNITPYTEWMSELIKSSMNLEVLKVTGRSTDPDQYLCADVIDPIKAIALHPHLTRLDFRGDEDFTDACEELFSHEGFSSIQEVVKCQNSIFQASMRIMVSSFSLTPKPGSAAECKHIRVPCQQSIKRLILPVIKNRNQWAGSDEWNDWPAIINRYIDGVSLFPHLEGIQAVNANAINPEYEPDINKWCSKQICGMIIRTYTLGNTTLTHIRFNELSGKWEHYRKEYLDTIDGSPLENLAVRQCGGLKGMDCKEHRWTETSMYDGKEVPSKILDQVYATMNQDRHFTTPGRNLELPQEAWNLLEQWELESFDKWLKSHGQQRCAQGGVERIQEVVEDDGDGDWITDSGEDDDYEDEYDDGYDDEYDDEYDYDSDLDDYYDYDDDDNYAAPYDEEEAAYEQEIAEEFLREMMLQRIQERMLAAARSSRSGNH